jgi:hypothetical protein
MADLVTLADAKTHLRITTSSHDADITEKLADASAIILDYLREPADTWDPTTVPKPVKSAVFLMLTHLYEHRGDDPETDEALWSAIGRLLARLRDPAYA